MNRINMTRVILGGLVAGLIINASEFLLNGVVLADAMKVQFAKMNLQEPGANAMAVFVAMGFVIGIATIWLYAAIRPRFGAGPKTAAIAGLAVWVLAYVYGTIGLEVLGMVPARMAAIGLTWGLAEVLVAAIGGAYFYQEEASSRRAVSV